MLADRFTTKGSLIFMAWPTAMWRFCQFNVKVKGAIPTDAGECLERLPTETGETRQENHPTWQRVGHSERENIWRGLVVCKWRVTHCIRYFRVPIFLLFSLVSVFVLFFLFVFLSFIILYYFYYFSANGIVFNIRPCLEHVTDRTAIQRI
jgi:hypothetical protein